jgi:type IV pilus assembly protein PilO
MRLQEMVELLWKSQRGLLLLLGTLLVLNLLLFTVLERWIVPEVAEQESRFLQRQTEVRQLMRKQGRTAITPEQLYVLARQDTIKFQQAVPDYQEFTGLIEELLILSSRAHLDITQISYSSEELKKSPLLKLNLNFNVVGDYEQLKKFIHSLEQSLRLITIKQISLQGANDDGVNLRLNLETFFRTGSRES